MIPVFEGGVYETKAYGRVMYMGVRENRKRKLRHMFITESGKKKYIRPEELEFFFGDKK